MLYSAQISRKKFKKEYSDSRHASSLRNVYTWRMRRLSKKKSLIPKRESSLISVTAVLESSGPTMEKFKMVEQFRQQLVLHTIQ